MRFLIKFTVDEAAVGHVLAALNSHDGAAFDHLEIVPLEGPKPTLLKAETEALQRAKAKPKEAKPLDRQLTPRALNAQRHVIRILSASARPMRFGELDTAIRALGFKGVGSTMRHLADKGIAQRTDDGWKLLPYDPDRGLPGPTLVKEG